MSMVRSRNTSARKQALSFNAATAEPMFSCHDDHNGEIWAKLEAGELSYDLDGLRARVEA